MKSKRNNWYRLLKENPLYSLFHENTKIFATDIDTINAKTLYPILWKKIHFKSYPRLRKFHLPKKLSKTISMENIIKNRRSKREFSGKPISLNDVSRILLYSVGITYKPKEDNWNETFRAYPSAGARYPLETYLIVFNVKALKQGIYHYNVKSHYLEKIKDGNFKKQMIIYTNNQDWIEKASIIILITAVFKRTTIKYGNRGYRYIFLDAGHLAQNIYLMTTAMGLGCCTIGGFLDNQINKLLDIDNINESVIYIIVIGNIDEKTK